MKERRITMKRFFTTLTALLVLLFALIGPICAETEDYIFTFRNGIVWGATPEEVMVAEGTPDRKAEYDGDPITIYLGSDSTIAGCSTKIDYVFWNDRLACIEEVLTDYKNANETLENVKKEMIATYGEPNLNDYSAIIDMVKVLVGTIDEEMFAKANKYAWKLQDNRTLILLANINGVVGIAYLDQGAAAANET